MPFITWVWYWSMPAENFSISHKNSSASLSAKSSKNIWCCIQSDPVKLRHQRLSYHVNWISFLLLKGREWGWAAGKAQNRASLSHGSADGDNANTRNRSHDDADEVERPQTICKARVEKFQNKRPFRNNSKKIEKSHGLQISTKS